MKKQALLHSRRNPSARYRRLLELYREMHVRGELMRSIAPEHTFPGSSLLPQAHHIRRLVLQTGARTLLDYGSGKGGQYRPVRLAEQGVERWHSVQEYWDIERIVCYDPAYEPFSRPPQGRFDGVICTDVLEHCPEPDLPWIIAELFGFARRFVFASIACHPAVKRLPNGENAHCTVRPPQFWAELFMSAAKGHPGVLWESRAYTKGSEGGDIRLGNAAGAELSPVAIA
ncbi:MAG TPA: class I SAM-dependent methyltransferase [Burkholderiales bacterium]|nr:class I SAM-dependent methyltransferase [Burkholderiales bacterium]